MVATVRLCPPKAHDLASHLGKRRLIGQQVCGVAVRLGGLGGNVHGGPDQPALLLTQRVPIEVDDPHLDRLVFLDI